MSRRYLVRPAFSLARKHRRGAPGVALNGGAAHSSRGGTARADVLDARRNVVRPRTAIATQEPIEPRTATNAGKPRRGKSTTEDERTLAKLLERRLHELGLERASVEAVATKAGHVAELRFAGIPVDRVDVLKKAIGR